MNRLSVLFSFIFSIAFSQADIPNNYFSSPLKIPLQLSGTFGELRNNHFHSGLDIRTQQKEGIPIYAPADGYVNRIKVQHFGYGKALYIQHPNGYSTVYAHLKEYAGDIQAYVKKEQYKTENYEIEVFPGAGQLSVKKGDLIGYTGNSGGSGGPHLHFEIRDASSRPMNPLLFGIEIADTRKPLINSIFVYPIGEEAHANQNNNAQQLRLIPKNDGSYTTEKITAYGSLGFGISAVDQQNDANNRNGLYKIETNFNGTKKLEILFDRLSFAETRYINRYIDYGYLKDKKSTIQKLFIERNNPLSIFKSSHQNGYVTIDDTLDAVFSIIVSDFKENKVEITIPIEGKKDSIKIHKAIPKNNYQVFAEESKEIKTGKFTVFIPKEALYEDALLQIDTDGDVLNFHQDNIPIHSNITLQADISHFDEESKNKTYIGKLNYKGEAYFSGNNRRGNTLTARVRNFGNYGIAIDTVAPTITPVNFTDGKWISNNKTLEIKIEDKESGIKGYRAEINGKWILMEYEYKKNLLTYDFNDHTFSESENNLKVIVTDNVGNSTKFEATFFRK